MSVAAYTGIGGAFALSAAVWTFIPHCDPVPGYAPAGLQVAAAGVLAVAIAGPVRVAGRRMWWIGQPLSMFASLTVWLVAGPILASWGPGMCPTPGTGALEMIWNPISN